MADPRAAQLLVCVEFGDKCEKAVEVPFGLDMNAWTEALKGHGWVASVMSPPGASPVVLSPLCGPCAEDVHPEIMEAMRAGRVG